MRAQRIPYRLLLALRRCRLARCCGVCGGAGQRGRCGRACGGACACCDRASGQGARFGACGGLGFPPSPPFTAVLALRSTRPAPTAGLCSSVCSPAWARRPPPAHTAACVVRAAVGRPASPRDVCCACPHHAPLSRPHPPPPGQIFRRLRRAGGNHGYVHRPVGRFVRRLQAARVLFARLLIATHRPSRSPSFHAPMAGESTPTRRPRSWRRMTS